MSGVELRTRLVVATALLACAGFAAEQQSAVDLDGRAVNPFSANSGKVVVLVFLRRDCPVSSRYAPVIQQISKQYSQEYGYHLPALRDPAHVLVKLGRAQITPEVAVFDRGHQLVYDGRIDDWYVELGRARPAPTTHELDDAIRAALVGRAVAKSEIRGVGCYISDLE